MFDVVFVSDIFVPGGTSFQLAQNIRLINSLGKRVGVVPVQLPHARGRKPINRFVREVVSAGNCEIIPGESSIATELLVIDNPRLMAPDLTPKVRIASKQNAFFVPFPPRDGNGAPSYDPIGATEVAHRFCDGDFVWAPVADYVRTCLRELYPHLELSRRNAQPIVDTGRYRFRSKLANPDHIAVGRHSRPQRDKWPPNRAQFLKVYPAQEPYEVALLGIDSRSLSELIGTIPANYRVHPFGSIDPAHFLSSVDFFVYYHHPSWREALGIATVEAMATGALCVLPRYMEANFGDAALYAAPNEVRAMLQRYHRDPAAYESQTRKARRFASSRFSPDQFAQFLSDFDITSRRSVAAATAKKPRAYEAIYAADFASPKIFNRAFFDEAVCEAERGTKVALVNLNKAAAPQRFVLDLLAENALDVIDDERRTSCDRLAINDPQRVVANAASFHWLAAKEATLLASFPHGQLEAIDSYLSSALRPHVDRVRWASRDPQSRMWIEGYDPNLTLLADDWPVQVSEATRRRLRAFRSSHRGGKPSVIGVVGLEEADDAKWASDLADDRKAAILTLYGERPSPAVLGSSILATGYLGMDMLKWVSRLDALLVPRERLKADNAEYLIALAEEIDVPVITRPKNTRLRAKAPVMLEAKQRTALFQLIDHRQQVPQPPEQAAPPTVVGRRRRILFVSQNGTGVGHVVRQLAIARKLAEDHDCLFLTMSQAIAFISAWGFHVEYFPSSVYSGVSHTDWEFWLRRKVELTLDAWAIDCVVFDGNVPYLAVAEAAAARRHVASVWIRRGMWPDSEVDRRRLRSQVYFDTVIEPLDFADEIDSGPTSEYRDTVRTVPPIQLLEREELLSRREACRGLGIDPNEMNVLVQLGSGNNRDIQSLRETVDRTLKRIPNARVYNLRWPISDMPALDAKPNADLQVFPAARFFNAFDFSIAAAGYNTAHEVLGFGLPTIFVPNDTPGMDNQAGRSEYAEARGVAVRASAGDLEAKIHSMADPKFRGTLRRRLARLKMTNGAAEAADVIRTLCIEREL